MVTTMSWVQYGLQRTGTNWVNQLFSLNLKIGFRNSGNRTSSLYKHTRMIFDLTFDKFDQQVAQELKIEDRQNIRYVVTIKHPCAWYISFRKWCQKCKSPEYNGSGMNPDFMDVYSQFYCKWIEYQRECPDRVHIFCYEKLLQNPKGLLEQFQQTHSDRIEPMTKFQNVTRVKQSGAFSTKQKQFYLNSHWKRQLNHLEIAMIKEHTSPEIVQYFGFEF